jgi:parvulin-like peptidyl-prolyl isomerase
MEPLSRADQPGTLHQVTRAPNAAAVAGAQPRVGVSSMVEENVVAPAGAVDATQPTTTGVGISTGQYYELGGVVANVNGTPIFANKLIKVAEPALSAQAKALDERQFRTLANKQLFDPKGGTLKALVEDQLEYAAAERNLDQKDKDLADMYTTNWRTEQIRAAGGSEVVARQRATARGEDFDELVQQQYRIWMSRIYYQKKIVPRVVVSAADIRSYYERNRDREFSDPGSARFRLIKIENSRHGGRDEALHLITELRNRIAKAGESFEAIAHSANDDPRLAKNGGDLGTAIQKGAFAIAPVDDAVWKTDIGKVTEVIETPNAFYIALVEQRTPGKVRPFDEDVQAQIDKQLSNELFREARMAHRAKLVEGAAVFSTTAMQSVAMEMAMQNYPRWRAK